jgi:hypothetical protein
MENNVETLKFGFDKDYELKLSFDEPKTFDGQFGPSIVYGATYGSKDIRFYASKGLHEEIQHQQLKKGDICQVKKVKPGDYPYFIVNGQSKHLDQGESKDVGKVVKMDTASPDPSNNTLNLQALDNRIKALEATVEKLTSKDEVPF